MNKNDDIPRLEAEEKIKIDIDFENLNVKRKKPFRFFVAILLILLATLGAFIIIMKIKSVANNGDKPLDSSVNNDIDANSAWNGAFASEKIFNACREVAVSVIAEGKVCSGFVYSSDGWIATVEGIVNENVKGQIEVVLFDGSRFFVDSFRQNRESGLILMKINADGLRAANCVEGVEIFAGEELFTFCAIDGAIEEASLFSGKVAHAKRNVEIYRADGGSRRVKLFQLGILLTEQGVGAPLFNENGAIVGIACSSGTTNERYMIDYAFSFNAVEDVLEMLKNGKRAGENELFDVIVEQ